MDTALKQRLKAAAHHLKPVVLIGAKGLTEAVVAETDVALKAHELIKVKIKGLEKEDRNQVFRSLTESVQAELLQNIGAMAVLYRKNND